MSSQDECDNGLPYTPRTAQQIIASPPQYINLTTTQIAVLDAIYDTFIPPITQPDEVERIIQKNKIKKDTQHYKDVVAFLARPGSACTQALIANVFNNKSVLPEKDARELLLALTAMGTAAGMFVLTGYYCSFQDLDPNAREVALKWLSTSYIWQKRMLFNSLRGLMVLYWFSYLEEVVQTNCDGQSTSKLALHNPIWSAVGYCGPDPNCFTPKFTDLIKTKKIWYLPKNNNFKVLSKAKGVNINLQKLCSSSQIDIINEDDEELKKNNNNNNNTQNTTKPELTVDVVIAGSGAGGGVCALQLANAGYNVLVLESGRYYSPDDLPLYESPALRDLYLNGGGLTTANKAISLLAGGTFGGGTAVNWSCSLRTPAIVRTEWSEQFGVDFCETPGYTTCLDHIEDIMQVSLAQQHNQMNQVLLAGAKQIGFTQTKVLPQNGPQPDHQCGWCCYGCKYQQKQGTNTSFLPIAMNKYNCQVLTQAKVIKVLYDNDNNNNNQNGSKSQQQDIINQANEIFTMPTEFELPGIHLADRYNPLYTQQMAKDEYEQTAISTKKIPSCLLPQTPIPDISVPTARGVECLYTADDGTQFEFVVNAKVVVLSAGALHTPLILQRSQIVDNNIGKYLRIHPVMGLCGVYPEKDIVCWKDAPMTTVCEEVKNIDPAGYGTIIETPSSHLGLLSYGYAWQGGMGLKELALNFTHAAPFIALNREKTSFGVVTADPTGRPICDYNFTAEDRYNLLQGALCAYKIHCASPDCKVLLSPFWGIENFEVNPILRTSDPLFKDWLRKLEEHGLHEHTTPLFSAHQMGTVRLSADPTCGPTAINGELYKVANLFIADTSLFPTASGVNPMLSVMALSQYVSLNIQQRLMRLKKYEELLKKQNNNNINTPE